MNSCCKELYATCGRVPGSDSNKNSRQPHNLAKSIKMACSKKSFLVKLQALTCKFANLKSFTGATLSKYELGRFNNNSISEKTFSQRHNKF